MKRFFIIAGIAWLTGCAPHATQKVDIPPHMAKLVDNKDTTTYLSFESISLYNGNAHLRQFYLINNYKEAAVISKSDGVSIKSSSAINVINCDRSERAIFDRVYFSELFAKGKVIAKRDSIGQWESFPEKSIAGIIREMVCNIPAEKLKDISLKNKQQPLIH